MDWSLDAFETVVKIKNGCYYGEDSGFYYEKEDDGWWVDVGDGERGPYNTLEHATECMAYAYGW